MSDENKSSVLLESELTTMLHAKATKAGIPVSATIELTSRCNFNCKMCYIHSALQPAESEELSTDRWLDIARELRDMGVVYLLITGGEPLVRSDFVRLYFELAKLGFVLYVNTNGSLISDEILSVFKKYPPFRVNVSLYGASGETYKSLCENNSFERVVGNIKKLKKIGIDVHINTAINRYNKSDIDGIFEICNELDCHVRAATYMYPQLRQEGTKEAENPARLLPADAAAAQYRIDLNLYGEEQVKQRVKHQLENVQRAEETAKPLDKPSVFDLERCKAGRSSIWITWRGEVTACGMMNSEKLLLDEMSLNEAWQRVKEYAKEFKRPEKCRSCRYRYMCRSCAAQCYTETGRLNQIPEYICAVTEEKYKLYTLYNKAWERK